MLVGFAIAVAFAWAYSKLYSPRAAYIHFGAMLQYHGRKCIFVIIPSQKAMVKAAGKARFSIRNWVKTQVCGLYIIIISHCRCCL